LMPFFDKIVRKSLQYSTAAPSSVSRLVRNFMQSSLRLSSSLYFLFFFSSAICTILGRN